MVGIHEAQEMSQLRIEVASLTEELEFLRTREEKARRADQTHPARSERLGAALPPRVRCTPRRRGCRWSPR